MADITKCSMCSATVPLQRIRRYLKWCSCCGTLFEAAEGRPVETISPTSLLILRIIENEIKKVIP